MLFNRRHSAASSSLVLSGIAKVEPPVCWFEMAQSSTAILAASPWYDHWQCKARGGARCDNGRHSFSAAGL